jgi:hypothetical protein
MSFLVLSSAMLRPEEEHSVDFESDLILLSDESMIFHVFSSAMVMDVKNGTVLALNLIESCFLT